MEESRTSKIRKRAWLRGIISAAPLPVSPGTASDFKSGPSSPRLLHLNESPYPPSPVVAAAIRTATDDLNRYPDPNAAALTIALSRHTDTPTDRIVIGAGSEELIRCIIDAALDPGDEIVVPAPSWPVYETAIKLHNGVAIRVSLDKQGANDADSLLRAISDKTRVVICCTPNPPTGGMMSTSALQQLIAEMPDRVLLVVDEAYHEFARHAGGPDPLELLAARSAPWVSLRTFSKAYGLAALRVGYALCGSLEVAQAIRKIKLIYSPPTVAQAAALAALGDQAYLKKTVASIEREVCRLSDGLASFGLQVWPSVANFVSIRLPFPAKPVVDELRAAGILVRDWRDSQYLNAMRITVGRPEDTDAVLRSLNDIFQHQNYARVRGEVDALRV